MARSPDLPPPYPTPITCVVADDHPVMRQALVRLLGRHGVEVIGQAADGREALAALEERRPAVAIVDLVMPKLGGVEVARRAAQTAPETRVILHATFAERERLSDALDAGALGFVLKEAPVEETIRAVTIVASGRAYVDPALEASVVRAAAGVKVRSLSLREQDILRLLADGKTNKEIADALNISPDTVRTYIRRALEKLDARSRTQAVAIALRRSLIH